MSDHSKQKIKKQIHRWCKKGRKEIEMKGTDFMTVAKKINNRYNYKNFKCYIEKEALFGWCHYMFRYITTDKLLKELDLYFKDTMRAMKTGKHNKANYKALTEDDFKEMGWVSLVQLFHLYRQDFDYYCEIIDLL